MPLEQLSLSVSEPCKSVSEQRSMLEGCPWRNTGQERRDERIGWESVRVWGGERVRGGSWEGENADCDDLQSHASFMCRSDQARRKKLTLSPLAVPPLSLLSARRLNDQRVLLPRTRRRAHTQIHHHGSGPHEWAWSTSIVCACADTRYLEKATKQHTQQRPISFTVFRE